MKAHAKFVLGLTASMLIIAMLACASGPVARFFPTATPTPTNTPTNTPTPTITPSPTATETPTPTLTPTPLPTGVASEKQPDGSTVFTDYDNGYQLTLAEDWIVIPISAEDLSNLVGAMAAENPELAEQAEAFEQLDPDVFRMVAINQDPGLIAKGYATNVTVAAIEDPTLATMPLAFISAVMEDSFESNGAEILTQGVNEIDNPNNVEVEYLDLEQTAPTPSGGSLTVRARVILFQVRGKLMMLTIAAPKEFSDEVFPLADDIGGSIELLQ